MVYVMLFAIIFVETGLVISPFLPGDSLLFAAGALSATGMLDIRLVVLLMIVAAIIGDAVNYAIGRNIGPRVFTARTTRACFSACSIASTSRRRTTSSRNTAAWPWCRGASCRSCAPSCRSSRARRR